MGTLVSVALAIVSLVLASFALAANDNHDPNAPRASLAPAFTGIRLSLGLQQIGATRGSASFPSTCPGAQAVRTVNDNYDPTSQTLASRYPELQQVSLPAGWGPVYDANAPPDPVNADLRASLGWISEDRVGDVSQLQWLQISLRLRNPAGRIVNFYAGPSYFLRKPCPSALAQVESPIGPAFPVEWTAGSGDVGKSGCGFVRVASSRSDNRTRFSISLLVTDDLGGRVDTRPSIFCRGGKGEWRLTLPEGFEVHGTLSKVASMLAGRQMRVHCGASHASSGRLYAANNNLPDDGVATTLVGSRDTYLFRSVCLNLSDSLLHRRPNQLDLAASALTFAHQLAHVRGIRDEHGAQCFALASSGRLARALGVQGKTATARFTALIRARHRKLFPDVAC